MDLNCKSSYLESLLKEYVPAGIILSILSGISNNSFNLNYFLTGDFIYRFLISIILISIIGIAIVSLCKHYNKIINTSKWMFILVKGVLCFSLPVGVISFIFDYTPGDIFKELIVHIFIILAMGLIYGAIKWHKLKQVD